MAGSTDFQISMILKAVNEMSPIINQAKQSISSLQTSINGLNTSSNKSDWFDKAIIRAEQFDKTLKSAQEKMDSLISSGKKDLMTGAIMAAPLVGMVKSAADVETTQTTLKLAGLSQNDVNKLTNQANDIMAKTMFNTSQVLGIDKSLAQVGMDYSKINTVAPTATYLAELEGNRNGADPIQTAKQFAQMSEQLGISRDANKVNNFADMVNRIATVTSADVGTLSESSKYFNLIGQIQGLNANDIMMTQGLAARFGLEGSIGGTHLKDFYQRLNPYTHLGTKAGQVTLSAFQDLGWLNGVQKDKKGNITGFSGDVFHDDKGNLLGSDKIFSILGQTYKKSGNKEQFNALLTRVLGQQGQDVAAAVAQNPDAFANLKSSTDKVPTINQGVKDYQQTFNQNFHAFASNLIADGQQIGNIVLPTITSYLKRLNDAMPAVQKFIDAHKPIIKDVVGVWAGLAGFKIGKGLFKITFGSTAKEILGIARAMNKVAIGGLKFGKYIKDFRELSSAAKLLGAGNIGSFAKAFEKLNPKTFKVFSTMGTMFKGIGKGLGIDKTAFSAINYMAKNAVKSLKDAFKGVNILEPLKGAFKEMPKLLKGAFKEFPGALKSALSPLKTFGSIALNAGKAALSFGANLIKLGAQALIAGARMAAAWVIGLGPIGWIIMGVIAVTALLWVAWQKDWGNIREHTTQTVAWIKTEFNKAVDFFKSLPTKMSQFGKDMMNGLVNGIKSISVKDVISNVATSISGTFKSILGIHSPSRVFAEHGKFIVQGLALGMNSNGGLVKSATSQLASQVMRFNAQPQLAIAGGYKAPSSIIGASDSYQDKRQINVYITAKDENEAYTGVKKALKIDDKYVASRRPKKKPWED